ncbi:adenylate/guanylate cyclase domain-containing protein [Aeromonas sp. MR16]|uniref:adenylate/guanylate cyclase domain-containing protein n=1 Tax=Aeromonas sp. MR16 TaxID=2923420 RepID=UPI001F4AE364|nr:adenylate/guanylate cyclase domain-containing protein [Aeromonas sp. MR16]MCH7371478.1 adenylate/guanylate cyclase domain-containing protein [Aeromonas sp. MR16]
MSSIIKNIYEKSFSHSKINEAYNRMTSFSGVESVGTESFAMDSHDLLKSAGVVAKSEISVENDYDIQRQLRRCFGKEGVNNNKIGGHPDFDYLVDNRKTKKGYVTTLFIDIKNSTKLGLIYPPEKVFSIKNDIIKCAIETILAFDGHVHRIMGDAVLAFFRTEQRPENSAVNAINCAVCLVKFIEEVVSPDLEQQDIDPVSIRIGIDYGSDENVLWGMYGYQGASEVTATSFYVDVAAKLQQSASKNKIMIGDSLKCLIDIPEHYLDLKKEGDTVCRYVKPNYRDATGNQINYSQFELNNDSYFKLLPLKDTGLNMIPYYPADFSVDMTVTDSSGSPSQDAYYSCARIIPKKRSVRFKVTFKGMSDSSYQVKYRVENNGLDAKIAEPENRGNHETFIDAMYQQNNNYFAVHLEPTAYLGLHYMYISIYKDGQLHMPEKKIGVYVA